MKVGIDRLSFYTSHYYLELSTLAKARGIDPEKFTVGLGQEKMAVPAPDEGIVTLAANAAKQAINDTDPNDIDTILFATESGIDQSKAAGVYVKGLLNLPHKVRVVELKQACYSGTAALQMACAMVTAKPNKKVLILAADIARYGLNTAGESSQGCAAIAMLVSANPRILAIEPGEGLYTDCVMDFWRPNYRDEALVDGHYSTKVYLHALEESWKHYEEESGRQFKDHDYFCYHNPIPRLVEKAHQSLMKLNQHPEARNKAYAKQAMEAALYYGRQSGNGYSASLYTSLASLLDNTKDDMSNKRIGFYSYGSGCVAEYFSGVVQPTYRDAIDTVFHQTNLANRHSLTYQEYETFYSFRLPKNGGECATPRYKTGAFRLAGIKDHKRIYKAVNEELEIPVKKSEQGSTIKAVSPGKLILSGEHAVVYGKPALAMAIDRYVETTVNPQEAEKVSFNLLNFNYKDSLTINTLREMKNRVKSKYQSFLKGESGIRDVLQTPFELTQYAAVNLLDHMKSKLKDGLDIHTESTIPVGCGMGSSAASVLSTLKAMSQLYDVNWTKDQYMKLASEVEALQHGKPSGVDLQIALNGGCIYFKAGETESRPLPTMPMFLVNTGTPSVSTGECVSYVREHFADSTIWNTFETVTNLMDQSIKAGDLAEFKAAVRDNHRLLVQIGVVPQRVQDFIAEIESLGGAAKICGAGAITGDQAGAVLVVIDDESLVSPLCERYAYEVSSVKAEPRGAYVG